MAALTAKKVRTLLNGKSEEVSIKLLESYPAPEVVRVLLDIVKEDKDFDLPTSPCISVTASELENIQKLFRVKGTDGRGRKKKIQ